MNTTLSLERQECATILAALHFYYDFNQGEPGVRSDEIHRIATADDEDISMDQEGIRGLAEKIAEASHCYAGLYRRHTDDEDEEEDDRKFTNYYVHCRTIWSDDWSCMCNDKCPVCGAEIEPFMSVENASDETIIHVGPDFVPEDGWPEGVTNLEQLKEKALDE